MVHAVIQASFFAMCSSRISCTVRATMTLRLVAQMDEESGETALLVVCNKCRQREILPVR
jgi:hypothetical protein